MWYVVQTQSRMPTSCSMAASGGMFVHSGGAAVHSARSSQGVVLVPSLKQREGGRNRWACELCHSGWRASFGISILYTGSQQW